MRRPQMRPVIVNMSGTKQRDNGPERIQDFFRADSWSWLSNVIIITSSDWSGVEMLASDWSVSAPGHYWSDDQAPHKCIATDQFISGLLCPDVSSQFENWSPIWVSFILPGRAGRACYKNSLTEQLISKRLASNCVNCSHHQPSAHTKHLPSSGEIVKKHAGLYKFRLAARVLLSLSGECTLYIWSDPHTRNFSHVLISLSNS